MYSLPYHYENKFCVIVIASNRVYLSAHTHSQSEKLSPAMAGRATLMTTTIPDKYSSSRLALGTCMIHAQPPADLILYGHNQYRKNPKRTEMFSHIDTHVPRPPALSFTEHTSLFSKRSWIKASNPMDDSRSIHWTYLQSTQVTHGLPYKIRLNRTSLITLLTNLSVPDSLRALLQLCIAIRNTCLI